MNSLRLSNLVWSWIKNCSVMPNHEMIINHMNNYKDSHGIEGYTIMNARKRIFDHLEEYEKAVKVSLDTVNDENIDAVHRLWDGIK